MPTKRLARMHSHAEYGGKLIGEMTPDDLSQDGDWLGTFGELVASVTANGILNPLQVDRFESGELTLRNGHHRAVIAIQAGMVAVPVVIRQL